MNKSSEDSTSTDYRVLPVAGVLPVLEKSAVPILTGKKPASNRVLTTSSPVTEVSQLQRIDGDKLVGQFLLKNFFNQPVTEPTDRVPAYTTFSDSCFTRTRVTGEVTRYRPVLPQFFGHTAFSRETFVTERHQPTSLSSYGDCWLQRKAAEPPLWTGRRLLHMSLSLLRSSSVHPVLPTPVSLCRTVEPPGTGYKALLHV